MAFIELRPQHIVLCFLLHPDGHAAFNLVKAYESKGDKYEEEEEEQHTEKHFLPPIQPTLLLVESGEDSASTCWNGLGAPMLRERPFITAVNTIISTTGLQPSDIRLVRSGPIISVIDKVESDEGGPSNYSQMAASLHYDSVTSNDFLRNIDASGSRTGIGSPRGTLVSPTSLHYIQVVVPDLFRGDDDSTAYKATEWLVHPFLFQAINLNNFHLSSEFRSCKWVTPLEIEVQNNELAHCNLIPDISRIVASVYIPPLFNKVIANLALDRYKGASTLTRETLELFEVALQDAWRVTTGDSDEPGAPPPKGCDELDLGAPYLSQLPARRLLEHIRCLVYHLSQIRPAMAGLGSMCRYIDHHARIGLKFLEQCDMQNNGVKQDQTENHLNKRLKTPSPQRQQQPPLPTRQGSFFQRFSFHPFIKPGTSTGTGNEDIDKEIANALTTTEHREKRKVAAMRDEEQQQPATTPKDFYNKSIGRVLLATATYSIFLDSVVQRCVIHAKNVLREYRRIMVYGGSSLVEAVVKKICGLWCFGNLPILEIICPEGRPLFEGVKFAQTIIKDAPTGSVRVKIISEAEIGIFVHHVDCVLVGADSILPDGSFVNKVGTYLLALAAFNAHLSRGTICNVPLFVLTTTATMVTQEALDHFSRAQENDCLISIPPQHPEGLQLEPNHPFNPILSELLCGMNTLSTTKKSKNKDETIVMSPILQHENELLQDFSGNMYIDNDTPFKVPCHLLDARAPLGVMLEEKEPQELIEAYTHAGFQLFTPSKNKTAYLTISNVYFETIPSYLVAGYITEHGLLRPNEIGQMGLEFNDMVDQYAAEKF